MHLQLDLGFGLLFILSFLAAALLILLVSGRLEMPIRNGRPPRERLLWRFA